LSFKGAFSVPGVLVILGLLDAMGNSGRPEFFSAIDSAIATGTDPLQSKAVFSLRAIQTDEAESLLSQELFHANASARLAAAQAMSLAPSIQAFQPALQTCASQESVAEIQNICRAVLSPR
jgi:hypothetical protein